MPRKNTRRKAQENQDHKNQETSTFKTEYLEQRDKKNKT